jgi:hypothetical protein
LKLLELGPALSPEGHHQYMAGNTRDTFGKNAFSPGVDSMAHYEEALRQVRYRNWRPATLTNRRFRLTCSELNGRYTSNEFNLEVREEALSIFPFLFHPFPTHTLYSPISTTATTSSCLFLHPSLCFSHPSPLSLSSHFCTVTHQPDPFTLYLVDLSFSTSLPSPY